MNELCLITLYISVNNKTKDLQDRDILFFSSVFCFGWNVYMEGTGRGRGFPVRPSAYHSRSSALLIVIEVQTTDPGAYD